MLRKDRRNIDDLMMLRGKTGKQNHFVSDFVISITIYLPSPRLQHQYRSKAESFYFMLPIAAHNVFPREKYKNMFYLTGKFIHVLFTQYLHHHIPGGTLNSSNAGTSLEKEWTACLYHINMIIVSRCESYTIPYMFEECFKF